MTELTIEIPVLAVASAPPLLEGPVVVASWLDDEDEDDVDDEVIDIDGVPKK